MTSLLSPHLSAFAAVLGEGSFEAAARRLSVTPSAISQRIKALEDRLGQVLILRQLPCRATASGRRLLQSVLQMQLLESEALDAFAVDRSTQAAPAAVAIAVNADSLATWFLGALADLHTRHGLLFDVRVEDQDHSLDLLRDGSVLGAVTTVAQALQGCTARALGAMRYLPVASPTFVARHFAHGLDAAALARAPMLVFNRKDALQARFVRSVTRARIAPPVHYLPSSTGFVEAAALGLGWAMAPAAMLADALRNGSVQPIAARRWLDVPLYWQTWSVRSLTLTRVGDALTRAAAHALRAKPA